VHRRAALSRLTAPIAGAATPDLIALGDAGAIDTERDRSQEYSLVCPDSAASIDTIVIFAYTCCSYHDRVRMKATENPSGLDVSVVMPVSNGEHYVARAIESVLAQTCPPAEIIVVDDGSTDNTEAVVRHYESAVRYLWQTHAGASAAR